MSETAASPPPPKAPRARVSPGLKFALELGPLLVFFFVNYKFGIFPATGALMAGVIVALAASWALTRHIPVMPLVTAFFVLVFGGLTLALHDSEFIKLKPTIVNTIFGAALLGGLAFGKPLLPIALDSVLQLDEAGWRKLTLRWGLFFFVLAILNEAVWRTQTESFWVGFKVFGVMPLTAAFALAQTPLILRHQLTAEEAKAAPEHF
jgi:intracellular septation protein